MLKSILAASLAPRFIPMRLLAGENAPSNRIQMGHIGVGCQGTGNLRNFLAQSDISNVTAICDPYRARRENAGSLVKQAQGHDPALYNDFRELLADKSIDAVVISTADHWHVPIGLAAVRAGKDVYIEKPLGYSLNQNKAMGEAIKKLNRVFQYGTQQRGQEIVKRGVELVRNGYIGDLKRIEVWAPGGRSGGSLVEIPVPEGLDYDLYLGPAPMKPCTSDRITNLGSYFCSDYSLGMIAGWGAHPLDVAVWAMDADAKGPYSVSGTGVNKTPDALFNTINEWDVQIRFSNGIPMHFMDAATAKPVVSAHLAESLKTENYPENGTTFFGSQGWVTVSRGRAWASNPEWLKLRQCEGSHRVVYKPKYYKAFAESVRDRRDFVAPIEDALRSDAISHVSALAIQNKAEMVWDPEKYQIVSPAALQALMAKPVRGDWKQS